MNFEFSPNEDSSLAFRSVFDQVSMGERLLRQSTSDPAGFRTSDDPLRHWDIRNSQEDIIVWSLFPTSYFSGILTDYHNIYKQ